MVREENSCEHARWYRDWPDGTPCIKKSKQVQGQTEAVVVGSGDLVRNRLPSNQSSIVDTDRVLTDCAMLSS